MRCSVCNAEIDELDMHVEVQTHKDETLVLCDVCINELANQFENYWMLKYDEQKVAGVH